MLSIFDLGIFNVIPLVVFGGALVVIFGFFINGALNLLFSNNSERGMEIVIKSLIYFLVFLVAFLIFAGVSVMVQRGAIFQPKESDSEFPVSPVGKFPPAPQFFEILGFGFSQPQFLSTETIMPGNSIFAVLCKKETGYDIIDTDMIYNYTPVSNYANYECWTESCDPANTYISFYGFERGSASEDKERVDRFKKTINPVCQKK
ncbi:MAG: hypothetical protein PHF44_04750 [Candidatus Pacebacteria bacterium]|nr:hypothetical protein [Candidatus Paceibacterota bacterium]